PMRPIRLPCPQPQSFMPDRDQNQTRNQEGQGISQQLQQYNSNQHLDINTSSNGISSLISAIGNNIASTVDTQNIDDDGKDKSSEKVKKKKSSSSKRKKNGANSLDSSLGKSNKRQLALEIDPTLPEELIDKLHNNSCELCEVRHSPNTTCRKQNQKKLKKLDSYECVLIKIDAYARTRMPRRECQDANAKTHSSWVIDAARMSLCEICMVQTDHHRDQNQTRNQEGQGISQQLQQYNSNQHLDINTSSNGISSLISAIGNNIASIVDTQNIDDDGSMALEIDPTLPEELIDKLHNNSCELCEVRVCCYEQ
ncbi:unnamed protein product, partial [Meganyctiphanes norvegica]